MKREGECLTSDSVTFGYHGKSDLLASGRRFCFLCRLAIQQRCQLRTLPTRLQGVQGPRLLSYFARPSIQTASGKPPFPRLSLRPRAAGETIIQLEMPANGTHVPAWSIIAPAFSSIAKVFDIHFKVTLREKGTRDDTHGKMDRAMKTSFRGNPDDRDGPKDLGAREMRTCPVCGTSFSATRENESCPVCMLRKAVAGGVESITPFSEDTVRTTPEQAASRFEHYEIVLNEDGKPLELGRGAMGVTFKAFDVDLRCPVTLKVISEKYLGDEAARVRFLREARAAASVRHPNVASVFHLGRRGHDYFYAMEFVEGETLDSLIKRSGPLEVGLALEITKQAAAGLAAVHKKKLVHRDIKPSNIMVSFEDEGAVSVKIIDLGLAKVVDEAGAQTTISASGAFAGTPEFASPEQVIGGEVDIRSDLYSLGVSLWQMLTGQVPFRGTAAGVMSQHQYAALPLEKLQGVPQPVVSLLEVLLDKDPKRRFQTPAELLKALPTITGAIEEGGTITYQSMGQTPEKDSYSVVRKLPSTTGPENISIARLPVTGSDLFGREEDITFLNDAWANPDVNVVTIVAWAGVGKSTLINHWLRGMAAEHYRSAELVYGWSFYRQGTSGDTSSADEFLDAALNWFGDPDPRIGTAWEKGERLAKLISHRRTLLVLDGWSRSKIRLVPKKDGSVSLPSRLF